jgi:uncharacterized protein
MKKKNITWNVFETMLNELARKIKKSNIKFDGVYGIPRGGLPIAVCLSHKLDIPLLVKPTKNALIVDDISDNGNNLNSFKNNNIATLFVTDWTITKPKFWVKKKLNKEEWIIFPWEKK